MGWTASPDSVQGLSLGGWKTKPSNKIGKTWIQRRRRSGACRTQPRSKALTTSQLHASQATAAGHVHALGLLFFIVGVVLLYFFFLSFFKRKQKLWTLYYASQAGNTPFKNYTTYLKSTLLSHKLAILGLKLLQLHLSSRLQIKWGTVTAPLSSASTQGSELSAPGVRRLHWLLLFLRSYAISLAETSPSTTPKPWDQCWALHACPLLDHVMGITHRTKLDKAGGAGRRPIAPVARHRHHSYAYIR